MTAPAPERPAYAYADLPADHPAPAAPAAHRRRGPALLLASVALACSATGAGTALLLQPDAAAVSATAAGTVSRSSGTVVRTAAATGTPESAAATVGPSVVTLAVSGPSGSGTGSGVVLRTDGTVLTNNHVVAGATSVTVTLSDGRSARAVVVGTDPTSDLAVVRATGLSGLTAAVFADSDELAVGQAVLAVGAPLGLSNTVTEGIVSTLHRPVRTGTGASEQSVIDAVQTDAAINPGNSGGALVDLAGRVVGVPSAIATAGDGSSGNIGVGFAIPSNDAVEVAEELLADGTADHPQVGVSVADGEGGALLRAVTAGGPAADAGLRAGDVVTAVGDRTVVDADSLIVAVRAHQPGEAVEVVYDRAGTERRATVTLATAG